MRLRTILAPLAAAAVVGASGCAFITKLTTVGGADAAAFTVDMEKYDVKSISIATKAGETLCPGDKIGLQILADAVERKKSKSVTLETASHKASANDARGKMDPTEFAMAGRGGAVKDGVFATTGNPFAVLMGFDIKATYRLDSKIETVRHFAPEYSCFTAIGVAGRHGSRGSMGPQGGAGGGAGGRGGPGEPGGPGPRLMAAATIIQTPLYERVGLIRVTGAGDQMTLFDLDKGITVVASGGAGGSGGTGGRGGVGQKPEGAGGPGGPGGDGAPGGDGGEILLILDERYPELAEAVGINVGGGMGGGAGMGGSGGSGAPAYKPCTDCKMIPAGQNGSGGPSGRSSSADGRAGTAEVRRGDVSEYFPTLEPGLRMRDDPRPQPEPEPEPPKKKGKRSKVAAR
ncbi:MAG: hypothetical protein R3B09_17345 [Nannocystaceae bacterium]